jgi:S-DNA-T family DNA segregation ATPase FtsK/SpoIIIE
MSLRIRTSTDAEQIVTSIQVLIEGHAESYKWYVLRLAIAVSLRMNVHEGEEIHRLRQIDRSKGGEYRLQQITGEGKKGRKEQSVENVDMTDALRAMLSVLHGEDLFYSEAVNFQHLLEYHIERGLAEIKRRTKEEDIFSLLLEYLKTDDQVPLSDGAFGKEEISSAFEELGFKGTIIGTIEAPRLNRYTIQINQHSAYEQLKTGTSKLEWLLGLSQSSIMIALEGRNIILDIPRPKSSWKHYGLTDLKKWSEDKPNGKDLIGSPGVDVLGNPYWLNIGRAPHIFVAGTTGSGKSSCIHALLCSLILRMSATELRFVLIDPKQIEFRAYSRLPHLLRSEKIKGVLVDPDQIRAGLEELCLEMERRYSLLDEWGVRDFDEAIATGKSLPRLLLVVDELADLILQIPMAQEPLERLAQKSRACGMHLLLATQRPDARTFSSGILRSNIAARIALGVQRAIESRIILDESGAEGLLRPGDMLVRPGAGESLVRVHGVYLNTDDIAHVVRTAQQRSEHE